MIRAGRLRTVAPYLLWLVPLFLLLGSEIGPALRRVVKAQGNAQARKLRVRDPQLAQRIERLGARLVADYGGFRLYEAGSAVAEEAIRNPAIELLDEYRFVLLNAGPLDTTSNAAAALRSTVRESFDGKRLHLVQFVGPTRRDWLVALRDTGVRLIHYLPHNAYLIYGDDASIGALRDLGSSARFIQWEAPYQGKHKVHPRAHGIARLRARIRRAFRRPAAREETELYAIQLVTDPVANSATLGRVAAIGSGAIRSQFRVQNYLNLIVRLDPADLDALAMRPDVVSIQPFVVPVKSGERQGQILAGDLSAASPGFLDFLAASGFTQQQFSLSGFSVDVSDSGVDNATTLPNHPGLYVGGDPSAASRVVYNRLEGSAIYGDTIEGCDGHGNINAHIVAGYGDGLDFPFADGDGFRYGLGVAPFVRVGSSVIFAPSYTYPNFPNLQSKAYNDGARISSNSWGSLVYGAYDIIAQTFDALVRDAQPSGAAVASPGNQEMVIVIAAGNEGIDGLRSPATAKNVITVGASENVHPFGGADGCGVVAGEADSAEDIADFSSRGPTEDGRTKPDLVAPGTHITGGVYQSATPGETGQAHPCFDGTGVCGSETSSFFPVGQQFYTTSSGTSHSAPAIAGGAALVRQHFINQSLTPPSPAMTKAFLMNSTRYLTGYGANDGRWSNSQGMGLMDLGVAFDSVPRILHDQQPEELFTDSGQNLALSGTIADPGHPFRVTLAWTDAPGSTTGPAFNNDLDLRVTVGGQTYKGNVFSGALSTPGGAADMRNNAESVFLPAGTAGDFTVTVTASNINSDGVPNFGGSLDQDFALVVYNGDEIPRPSIAPASATLTGEDCGDGNGVVDPGELITVELELVNVGLADTSDLVATLEATGGVTSPSEPQSYGLLQAGGAPASRSFSFVAEGICGGNVTATLLLQDGGVDTGSVRFDFELGIQVPSGSETTLANPAPLFIPAGGAASPYPSTIEVAGLTGRVADARVTLHGLSHPYPDDLDLLLVAPDGSSVVLMSDAGGGAPIHNVELEFDDMASSMLPDGGLIDTGTYRPTNWEGASDDFVAPAPAGPYGSTLGELSDADPNGTWSLYVMDDFFLDGGTIEGGWSVSFATTVPVCCGGGPGFVVNPASGLTTTESGSTATFTIALSSIPSAEVILELTSSDPTEGEVSPTELLFSTTNAQLPRTVTVTGVDDTIVDGDVAFTILTSPAVSDDPDYAGIDPPDVSVVNINDDIASLGIDDVSLTEGDIDSVSFVFTVTLSEPAEQSVSVAFATHDGTATTGSDFIAVAGTLDFPPGVVSRPILVAVNGDTNFEDDETFFVTLSGANGADLLDGQGVGTILNDDELVPPTLEVSTTSPGPGESVLATVSDGPGNRLDWVALAAVASPFTTNLDWQYLNGSRSAPATGLTSAQLTFAMPLTPGEYEFRFFADNGYTLLATSPVVSLRSPSLTVSVTSATAGEWVLVTVSDGPANRLDWLALAAAGSPLTSFLDWQYLNGSRSAPATGLTSAQLTFAMPQTPGEYEFRFFENYGYTLLATSPVVTVAPSTTPELEVSPASLSFGSVEVGSSAEQLVTIRNAGGGTLTGEATVTGAGFSFVGLGSYSLGAGETASLTVRFEPVDHGEASGALTLTGADGATVALSGSGTAEPSLAVSSTSVTPGESVLVTVSDGPGNLLDWVALAVVGSPFTTNVDWQYLSGSRSVPATGVTSAQLTFAMPQTPGEYEFRFFENYGYGLLAKSPLVTVAPSSTPLLEVSPASLSFGSVGVGSSAEQLVTVRNAGGGTLTGEATVTGVGFHLVSVVGYSLGANEAMTLTLRFEPVVNGEASGTLTLTGADGATVALGGSGTLAPTLVVSATSITPGESVQVTVSDGPGNRADWVALAAVGSPVTSNLGWQYLTGSKTQPSTGLTSALLTFAMPQTPGEYEFRFFENNGYGLLATSPVVAVEPPSLVVSTTSAAPGESVQVTVSNGPGNRLDWLALAAVGSPLSSYVGWQYLNGSHSQPSTGVTSAQLTFAMPQTPGVYEFRFFENYGYGLLATSVTVLVE